MKDMTRNKLHTAAKKAVQNLIQHETGRSAPACMGPFYQPKRPTMNKNDNSK